MSAQNIPEPKKRELFAKYLEESNVCIVDTSSASRVRLANTIIKLGAKQNKVAMVENYDAAINAFSQNKPRLVLADYFLGGSNGFDLLRTFRESSGDQKDSIFVLVTANSSQSAVARAAEEDVDCYILKPYTLQTLESSLVNTAIDKLFPSDYIKTINLGKDAMAAGKLDDAIALFRKAAPLNKTPTLALFYAGQVETMKKALKEAETDFQKGLTINDLHFKCMVGLFDILMSQKRFAEAYDVVKRIARYFPANPTRLTQVIRLSIVTRNYADVFTYYDLFTSMEQRTPEMVVHICAAAIVSAEHFLIKKDPGRAVDLLKKVGVSAAGKTSLLLKACQILVEYGLVSDADEFLKSFPAHTHKDPEFLLAKYLVGDQIRDAMLSIQEGRELLRQGIEHPALYRALIMRSSMWSYTDSAMELAQAAKKRFPEEAKTFEEAVVAAKYKPELQEEEPEEGDEDSDDEDEDEDDEE